MQNGTETMEKTSPKIITEPKVYVVGRQNVDRSGIDAFLDDYGMTWETDTEIGGEQLVEASGRLCYVSYGKGRKTNAEYVDNLIGQKHGSVLEHAVWNFIIAGVSRSFTHELVRHRAGWAYSQLSQRYVDESEANYVEPQVIAEDPELHALWKQTIEASHEAYVQLTEALTAKLAEQGLRRHPPPQDGPRGRALRAPQRHRDDDLRDCQRPRAPTLHRTARLRRRRGRDPPRRSAVPAHHAGRGAEPLRGLRDRHAAGRPRNRDHAK